MTLSIWTPFSSYQSLSPRETLLLLLQNRACGQQIADNFSSVDIAHRDAGGARLGGTDTGGLADGHAGGHDAHRPQRRRIHRDAAAAEQQTVNISRDQTAKADPVSLADGRQNGALPLAIVDVDLIAAKRHGVGGNDTVHDVVDDKTVDTGKAAGLADTDGRADRVKHHVLKAGHKALEHVDDARDLQMAVDLPLGQAEEVGAVAAGNADSVDEDLARNGRIDVDDVLAQHRQILALAELLKVGAHADENMGRRAAPEGGVVAGADLHGRQLLHILGMRLEEIEELLLLEAGEREHDRGRLNDAVVVVALLVAAACEVGKVAVTGAVDENIGADLDGGALAGDTNGGETAVLDHGVGQLAVEEQLHTGVNALLQQHELEMLGMNESDGVVHGAALVTPAVAGGDHLVDELLGDAADDLTAVFVEIAQEGQPHDQIAAKVAVALDEDDLRTASSRREGSGNTAGASADDSDIAGKGSDVHMRSPL